MMGADAPMPPVAIAAADQKGRPTAAFITIFLLCRNHSHSVILWSCESDPLSPPVGEAPQGGKLP
ncbi:MAG: hypothetical protein CVV32_10755 [Methanomicrobiales archaeon HGW-Methanomicrobiales-3]|nr:MAG: hypothetical protein CVV32_10755 [Methanomicrobiales archaeon HGW-Methanomicrobiales-3]